MKCATFLAIFGLMYSKTDVISANGSHDLPSPEYYFLLYTRT
jgi:hypothetical protein